MIHIVIPSYNCAEDLNRCLDSVMKQEGGIQFKVVIVDDASDQPRHGRVAKEYGDRFGWQIFTNETNMKAPYTIKQGIEASGAAPNDVILLLDGDDFLVHTTVNYLTGIYEQYPQIWLTYGSYQPYPDWTNEPHPSEYPTLTRWNRDFRNDIARYNHPISFRRFLWDALDDSDLQDTNGRWFTDGYDQVIMVPMLEMAGQDHYAFLTEILYYYNPDNPLSEHKLIAEQRMKPRAQQIRERPKKEPLVRNG